MHKNIFRFAITVLFWMNAFMTAVSVGYADLDGNAGEAEAKAYMEGKAAGKSVLLGDGFKFNPKDISPSTETYDQGSGNIQPFLEKVAKVLLIVVSTGAVLSIVIGGFYMATSGGDTEKANKGKIIITYNIIAICIAMLSYGIIQFVIWIIWV